MNQFDKKMIIPPYLQKGDVVGIAAPASKISEEELLPVIRIFEKEGFQILLSQNIYTAEHQYAGNHEVRRIDFQALIDNPDVKAILCARGGYGSVRIIDDIDFNPLKKTPKWLCGFSDITVFHSHLFRHLKMASLHCTMPVNIKTEEIDNPAVSTLLHALQGEKMHYTPLPHPLNRTGNAKGRIIGGNLSILYSLLGSESDIDTDGIILFIEDLDEYLYHIDRMMTNLRRNGKLSNLAALLVGGMTEMKDNKLPYGKNAEEIIIEHCATFDYPVVFQFPAGHIENNLAIKLGCEFEVICHENEATIIEQ